MGGACDLLPIPRAEPPHIQSTPDPPFPGHHGQETCRSGLAGLSTTLRLTGASTTYEKNQFLLLVVSKFCSWQGNSTPMRKALTYRATYTSSGYETINASSPQRA
jgi:hypothetical protein